MMWATVDGVRFEGDGGAGPFMLTDMKGWRSRPSVRQDATNRPTAHGVFDAPAYLGGRLITIEGEIYSPLGEQAYLINRITGILADGDKGRMVVEDGGIQWADVRPHGEPDVKIRTPAFATFQTQFWARDPRKYGQERPFTGSSPTVYHMGNFPALPVVEITGSLPSGYTVTSQGKTFKVSQPLSSGQTHRIDMRRGWLFRNNVLQSGAVDVAESFTIPVDEEVPVVFSPASGSGQMTVTVTDTYI